MWLQHTKLQQKVILETVLIRTYIQGKEAVIIPFKSEM